MFYRPWQQGHLLTTSLTKRLSDDEFLAQDHEERCRLFRHFTQDDQGKGRQLVACFVKPEDCVRTARAVEATTWRRIYETTKTLLDLQQGFPVQIWTPGWTKSRVIYSASELSAGQFWCPMTPVPTEKDMLSDDGIL
jgi:hypothetical protein